MKKDYSRRVSPQNTSHFNARRLIFASTAALIVINLVAFAIILKDVRVYSLTLAALFACYGLTVSLGEKRAREWTWFSLVGNIFILAAISAIYIWAFKLYAFIFVLIAEILFLIFFAAITFRRL